jgi:plastocyanin
MEAVGRSVRRGWILVPAVLLLPACGGTAHKAMAPPLQTVQVSEKEFSITPNTISLRRTGTYAFAVTNNGAITHAFEVEGHGVEGKTGDISPGSSARLTVDLTDKGDYEVYCPIDGHRSKGMVAKLTVGVSAAPGAGTTTTTAPTTATTTTTRTTTVPATTTAPGY